MSHVFSASRSLYALAAVVVSAVLAGGVGAGLSFLIEALNAVGELELVARLAVAALLGAACGTGWWWLRRGGPVTSVNAALSQERRLPFLRTVADALLQVVCVGAGASLGREQAPRQVASSIADFFAARIDPQMRARIVAGAAGAGLAAVYNVPLAGAIYAIEILPIKRDKTFYAVALAMSTIATLVARTVTGSQAFYTLPAMRLSFAQLAWLVPLLLLVVAVGVAFRRILLRRFHLPANTLPVAIAVVVAASAAMDHLLPGISGNGQRVLDDLWSAPAGWQALLAILVAKAAFTWFAIAAGAAGGILTPSLALGGLAGGLLSLGSGALGVETSFPAAVLLGAIGVLTITQRAPFFAIAFGLELTHAPWELYPPAIALGFAAFYATKRRR
ncbi:chloride channel protein [Corynebacterium vitaeruminis]|uniref:chloride channel protein n=1 Tax=Corynebacterium vitaeruminis TaxID=38305 RepID=UPI00046D2ADA|nr:chloride channel protein [Corynebacterium vitaeruminis]